MIHAIQHFAGMINVIGDPAEQLYRASEAQFALDYGASLPPLPAGIDQRIYEQSKCHALLAGNNVVDGGPMPWPEGDRIIEACPQLIAKVAARASMAATTFDMGRNIQDSMV